MRGTVISLRLRAELRRGWAPALALALLLGVAAGATAAAAAGARRTASAHTRLVEWSDPDDVSTAGWAGSVEEYVATLDRVEELPEVADSVRITPAFVDVQLRGKALLSQQVVLVDLSGRLGRSFIRVKLLRGSFPDPDSSDEVAIPFMTADLLDLDVGDELTLLRDGSKLGAARVTGVVAVPGEFPAASLPSYTSFVFGPGFARAYPDVVSPNDASLALKAAEGVTPEELIAALDEVSGGKFADLVPTRVRHEAVQRSMDVEAAALWSVAGALALVTLVLTALLVHRHSSALADEARVLSQLGLGSRGLRLLGLARGALFGVCGGLVAIAVAWGLSSRTPVGLARIAEPHPGAFFDARVLVGTALALLVLCAVVGAFAAHAGVRPARARMHRSVPLLRTRPSAAVGVHLAFDAGGSRGRGAAWSGVAAVGAITAMTVVTIVLVASMDQLVSDDDLAGATFDSVIVYGDGAVDLVPEVREIDGVEAATAGGWVDTVVNGRSEYTFVADVDSDIAPAVARGRPPEGVDEIALGAKELDALDIGIGDVVEMRLAEGDVTRSARVVGELVPPIPVYRNLGSGEGAATTVPMLEALGLPTEQMPSVLVDFEDPLTRADLIDELEEVRHIEFSFDTSREDIRSLGRLTGVPRGLVAALAVIGLVTLMYLLLLTARRRSGDIATLQALGLTRRAVGGAVAMQATTVLVAALVVGMPLGVAGGRVAWRAVADALVVVPAPRVEAPVLLAVGVLGLLVAGLAAVPSVRRLVARPAAVALRAPD